MLKGTKSTSMNFNSMINDKSAVYMSAQIPVNGSAKRIYDNTRRISKSNNQLFIFNTCFCIFSSSSK